MIGTKKKTKKANVFKEIADNFEQLTKNPERFLKPQPDQISAIEQLIQQTYSVSISGDVENKKDLLPELVLEHMDEEQIWQQLEIRNELVFPQLLEKTAKLMAMKEKHLGIELDDDEEEDEQLAAESDEDEPAQEAPDSDFDVSGSDAEDLPKKSKPKSVSQTKKSGKRVRSSVVDDTFFKLDEMKEFLEQEDAKEMRKQKSKNSVEEDADAIDYYADDFGVGDEEDEDDVNVNYADFFEVDEELEREAQKLNKQIKGKQRDYFNENEDEAEEDIVPEEEDEDENEENEEANDDQEDAPSEIDESEFVAKSGIEPASDSESGSDKEDNDNEEEEEDDDQEEATPAVQSSNELREARLFQRIRDYEDIVLGEKPWQLKGEVQAANRPQNSLLEEILDFESTTRPTAPLTEEDNRSIEDIIMQRIRDKAWDDVVRTVRVDNTPQEYRKQLVLDQEKSKQSLAQIYEKQYQQELEKLDPNKDDDNAGPEPKEHQEIKRMMRSLFLKLDALSNFHFTPKPVAPEIKIVTNTPAVHMEEVAPLAVSDAKLLAPEEVFRGPKHAPLGKTERTRTDKNRERRKKKQKQRAINAVLETRDLQRAKEGKAPTKREADAKLLKTITKSRNVQKITASTNDQGALKSSKAFFNKLQDTTATAASGAGSKRPKKDPAKANAKKLKL
ncbi:U3 small nucleolar ribonucleoprotein protein MPP10 [Drosophila guanche]|uniref:U3 small nucleolar ribonucleoprotein protein MPP10 n=1 Tax=Drosophila guanche TaxID=7266 RepID=A0A3B0KCG5_DROGU|nr:U3 small nucleolar ribonucleoprotein protein MPP10 [Drosophila guanche]SPP85910.1 blast:U3 small nucleolar ribonucleoprotein protein MPP10 [Drosophila guanche]